MHKRAAFIVMLLITGLNNLQAQSGKINLPLKNYLESSTDPEAVLQLMVKGSEGAIRESLIKFNGNFRYVFRDYGIATLSVKYIEEFSRSEGLERIEFSPHQAGYALNDTMLVRNRVVGVHNGLSPLSQKYEGKGIIIGFIDTGIDFTHPDFMDSLGNTRVLSIWDQGADTLISSRIPRPYNYGQLWDSTDINNASCPHDDDILSHGTNVAGIAAGNGLAVGRYKGVAPEADLIMVATDFSFTNWLNTVADGVEYIFKIADSLQKPCVINISAGSYLGSHDGLDPAALRIDSLVKEKPGRAVVCAAGNLGNLPFHLGYNVTNDTSFTWFKYLPAIGGVYLELWADTGAFNQVDFAFGADQVTPVYDFRGRTAFDRITNRLNMVYRDSIMNSGNRISYVETYAERIDGRYLLQVYFPSPDSSQYNFRFMTTGTGHFDLWGDQSLGISSMVSQGLPSPAVFPDIIHYRRPDTLNTVVTSWACLPSVMTVGNYVNRDEYIDVDTVHQTDMSLYGINLDPGQIAANSCLGPTRTGLLKPDITATGEITLTANRLASIPLHIANGQSNRIALGGMHKRNGGTSMASPVVAGTIALFFERCPEATHQQVMDLLKSNAYGDGFATTLPNFKWGYGKTDAFAVLTSGINRPSVLPALVNEICKGDQIELSGSNGYVKYAWETGDSTQKITIDTALITVLHTVDTLGCLAFSDTVTVSLLDTPSTPDIHVMDSLLYTTTPATSYQWYLDETAIPGANDSTWVAVKNGFYAVEVSNDVNCSALSDTVDVYISTGIFSINSAALNVYPNPSKGTFILVLPGNIPGEIQLTDMTGRRQNTSIKKLDLHRYQVEVQGHAAGIFLLRIWQDGKWINRSISLQ